MAGKSSREPNQIGFMWPIQAAFKLLLIILIAFVVAYLSMAYYLSRFHTNEHNQTERVQDTASFYVDQALNPAIAAICAEWAVKLVLEETRLDRLLNKPTNNSSLARRLNWNGTLSQFIYLNTYLVGAKIGNLIAYAPLFALLLGVAFVDGLVERHIRREVGENESATRYHFWKKLAHSVIPSIVIFVFLVCPVKIQPAWFGCTILIASTIGLRNQVKYFKKYF